MKRILALDADGTFRRDLEGRDSPIINPFNQKIMPEAIAALRGSAIFDQIIGITNQGGCGQYKSLGETILEQEISLKLARVYAPNFTRIYAALGHDGFSFSVSDIDPAECEVAYSSDDLLNISNSRSFRKPDTGLWHVIVNEHCPSSDSRNASFLFVGDRATDKQFALNAGIDFMWACDWWEQYAI